MTNKEISNNPLDGSTETNMVPLNIVAEHIAANIETNPVIKTPPVKSGDTGKYFIPIKQDNVVRTIVITTSQLLEGPKRFTTLFADNFAKRLFVSKENNAWNRFGDWIMQVATQGEPEETAAVMAGHLLLEQIANTMEVSTNKTLLNDRARCNKLIEHQPQGVMWYVLPSAAVIDMISEIQIKAGTEDISLAMSVCGMKLDKTHPVTFTISKNTPKSIRCWWFNPAKLQEINPDIGVKK